MIKKNMNVEFKQHTDELNETCTCTTWSSKATTWECSIQMEEFGQR